MNNTLKTIRSYHRDGSIADESTFLFDKKHGLETVYDEEGKITRQAVYINGIAAFFNVKKDGSLLSVFYDENNEINKIKITDFVTGETLAQVKDMCITGVSTFKSKKYNEFYIYSLFDSEANGVEVKFYLNEKQKTIIG